MPEPDDAPTRDARSRRQVLGYAGALISVGALSALSGCGIRLEQEPVRTPPPRSDDELARDRAAGETDDLLALLDDVRQLRPDAAVVLGRIASEHQAHLAALRLPPSTTTPSAKPAATVTATPTGPALTKSSALGVLAEHESSAAERLRGRLGPVSGDLARLLASIAASRSCHADSLTTLAAAR